MTELQRSRRDPRWDDYAHDLKCDECGDSFWVGGFREDRGRIAGYRCHRCSGKAGGVLTASGDTPLNNARAYVAPFHGFLCCGCLCDLVTDARIKPGTVVLEDDGAWSAWCLGCVRSMPAGVVTEVGGGRLVAVDADGTVTIRRLTAIPDDFVRGRFILRCVVPGA